MGIYLADIWGQFTSNAIGMSVLGVIGALTAYVLVIQAIKVTRETFGAQPPFGAVLREINAKLAALPNTFATLELVKAIQDEIKCMSPRKDTERFETEFRNRFVEFSEYEHKRIHDFSKVIESVREALQSRGERLSAVESTVRTLAATVSSFDVKLDRLIEANGELRASAKIHHPHA